MALDPARRALLLKGKLNGLYSDAFAVAVELQPVTYLAGAAAFDPAAKRLVVLVEAAQIDRDPLDPDPAGPRPARGWLGGAIAAAARAGAKELHLFADAPLFSADDARRASRCSIPTTLWSVVERVSTVVTPSAVTAPLNVEHLPIDEQTFVSTIERSGAVAIVENGMLRAEVLGLEVARVMREETTQRAYLSVGVGKHDRLAQAMMNAAVTEVDALANVVASIRELRVVGGGSHPANTLSRSRWLREMVILDPERFELQPPVHRTASTTPVDLKQVGVAAVLAMLQGTKVVAGCSVGVDLDAPTDLLDAAAVHGISSVVLLVPNVDDIAVLRTICATLEPVIRVLPSGTPFSATE